MALALRLAARSDVGLLREGNEDAGYAGSSLLVVADGMGGHVAGEVASSVTVTTLSALENGPTGPDTGGVLDQLADAVERANEQLRLLVAGDPALRGMGTTVTALLHDDGRIALAHVGDSRCYLLRDGALQRITRDHTFVQTLVDEGRITEEDAEVHPQRSLLTRALDGRKDVEPDLSIREARPGDRFLLCSDGLSGVVREETLQDTLQGNADPDAACGVLVDLALRAGGPDNITCIIADVLESTESGAVKPGTAMFVGAAARTAASVSPAPVPTPAPELSAEARRRRHVPTPDEDYSPASGGRRRLPYIALLGVLALLVLGAYSAYALSQRQYYVGVDGETVAIYRGVDAALLGVSLSRVEEGQPDVPLAALSPVTREQVSDTIEADDLSHARDIVGRLRQEATCPPAAPAAPAPTPAAAPPPALTTPTAPFQPEATLPGAAAPTSGAPRSPAPTPVPACVPGAP